MDLKFKSLALIGILLLLAIAWGVVRETISERSYYRDLAHQSVSESWTGEQVLTLPVLVAPYRTRHSERSWNKQQELYEEREYFVDRLAYIPLTEAIVSVELKSNVLLRGIFEVPVYDATVEINGTLGTAGLTALTRLEEFHDFGVPYLAVAVTDQRGLSKVPEFQSALQTVSLETGSGLYGEGQGFKVKLKMEEEVERFSLTLNLRGMSSFQVIPTSENLLMKVSSDWPHPSFVGGFLPDDRTVKSDGFHATWSTNRFSTGVRQKMHRCAEGQCDALSRDVFGVRHVDPVDHYVRSERAAKYGILVILLVFASFILIEVLQRLRVHPLSYLMVGCALVLFHLLLIALAEQIGFAAAYLVATLVCTLVISCYMEYQLGGRLTVVFGGSLVGVYAVLYLVILSEDYAFISGAMVLLLSLAGVMMVTRKVDWYDWAEPSVEVSEPHVAVGEQA